MRSFTNRVVAALCIWSVLAGVTGFAQKPDDPLKKPVQCVPTEGEPDPSKARGDFMFAVLGDTGRGCKKEPRQCQLAERMLGLQGAAGFKHMILLGDNVYNWGSPKGIETKIFDPYKHLSAKGVVIKGVVGNHDVISTRGSELQMRFFNLDNSENQRVFAGSIDKQLDIEKTTPAYYSFASADHLVEFFAIDSSLITDDYVKWFFWKKRKGKKEKDRLREVQKNWLANALKDSNARWKIVLMHHPMYSSADYHGVVNVDADGNEIPKDVPKEMTTLRQEIEQILVDNGVRLVLAGHDHGYEHIKPQRGIQHFVSGAGSEIREDDYDRTKRPFKRFAKFHQCGSVETSFMLFAATRDRLNFWNVGIDGTAIDHGAIR